MYLKNQISKLNIKLRKKDGRFTIESLVSEVLQTFSFLKFLFGFFSELVNQTDSEINVLHTVDDKLVKCLPRSIANKGFSSEIQSNLEELYEYDQKINDLLFKKIIQIENENKILKAKNNWFVNLPNLNSW